MRFFTKLTLIVSITVMQLHTNQLIVQQEPTVILSEIEIAIKNSDQARCAQLITSYINLYALVCKQQGGILDRYKTVYSISSSNDASQPLTPEFYYQLLSALHNAANLQDWNNSITCQCIIFDTTTYEWSAQSLTLQDIINGIEHVKPADFYLQPKYLKIAGASAAVITIVIAGCYLRNPTWFAPFGNAWQDLQDYVRSTIKSFTDPQTYEQFEKKHDLHSDGMSIKERKKRFKEWQTGDRKQQSLDNEMSLVKKLERSHGLLCEDLTEKDRRNRYKQWKRGDDYQKDIQEQLKIIKPWEKQHDLQAENLGEDYRIERYEQWLAGDLLRRRFLAIERLMKDDWWWQDKMRNKNDEERLAFYLQHTDPIQQSALENETLMKIQDNIVSTEKKITSFINKLKK